MRLPAVVQGAVVQGGQSHGSNTDETRIDVTEGRLEIITQVNGGLGQPALAPDGSKDERAFEKEPV